MLPMHFCWSPCLAKPWAHGASSISDITMFLSVNLENLSRAELSHWNSSLASLTQRDRFSLLCTSWGGFFFFFNYAEQVNHFLPLMYLLDFLKIKETKQPGETNCTCQPVGPLWNSVLEGTSSEQPPDLHKAFMLMFLMTSLLWVLLAEQRLGSHQGKVMAEM